MPNLITIPNEGDSQRLERWLRKKYPTLPYNLLQKCFRTGQIRLNGKRVKGAETIKCGDLLKLPPAFETIENPEKTQLAKPSPKTLATLQQQILYEDENICVLNKPPGLSVQGGTNNPDHVTLYFDALCSQDAEPLRLTHRIDKDTSGILLLAKNLETARYLTSLFKEGRVRKSYLAVIVGRPEQNQGHISDPIGKLTGIAREKMSIYATDAKESSTHYRILKTSNAGLTLLELTPQTGRTHQLRVHCAMSLECPILGDGKYGGRNAHPLEKRVPLHLHAHSLEFPLISGNMMKFTAPLPEYFQATLQTYF